MENTIRIHYILQGTIPTVPDSMNFRTTAEDGPEYLLITAGSPSDFEYWKAHLDEAVVPYSVAS